jgi:hypothetical protein
MSRLVFGRDQLLQLLLVDELFTVVPELVYVKQMRDVARPAYEESVRRSCCGGDARLMFPALDELMLTLRHLQKHAPSVIERFREFVAGRSGTDANPFQIYYRKGRQGLPDKLVL